MLIASGYITVLVSFIFFFQAEDGIRDIGVTGVQTCALPISAGGVHGTLLFNPQNVSGVGSVSGAGYRGTGETLSTFSGNVGAVSSLVNNFRIIGAGGAASLQVHENIAVVVNANGTVTTSID